MSVRNTNFKDELKTDKSNLNIAYALKMIRKDKNPHKTPAIN